MDESVWDAYNDLTIILHELSEDMFWETREMRDESTGGYVLIPQCIFCGLVFGMHTKHNNTCLVERARRVLHERNKRKEVDTSGK
jgi:hypothetical protein